MVVKQAIAGMTGFDVNSQMSASSLLAFKEAGMSFGIRYIPRTPALVAGNLTMIEIEAFRAAKMALSVVQHCPLPNWSPTAEMGQEYGIYAGQYAESIGLPKGMNIWLDLEGVGPLVKEIDAIAYCTEWFTAVSAAGYLPGLYVGFGAGISPKALFDLAGVQHYWSAYNYTDGLPTRGFQIKQSTAKVLNGISYDPNTISADLLGGLPMLLYPS